MKKMYILVYELAGSGDQQEHHKEFFAFLNGLESVQLTKSSHAIYTDQDTREISTHLGNYTNSFDNYLLVETSEPIVGRNSEGFEWIWKRTTVVKHQNKKLTES